jgi:hypothetical protein
MFIFFKKMPHTRVQFNFSNEQTGNVILFSKYESFMANKKLGKSNGKRTNKKIQRLGW